MKYLCRVYKIFVLKASLLTQIQLLGRVSFYHPGMRTWFFLSRYPSLLVNTKIERGIHLKDIITSLQRNISHFSSKFN